MKSLSILGVVLIVGCARGPAPAARPRPVAAAPATAPPEADPAPAATPAPALAPEAALAIERLAAPAPDPQPAAAPAPAPAPARGPPPPSLPPPAPVTVVPQADLEAHRVAGTTQIPLPEATTVRLFKKGVKKATVRLKVCLEPTGTPSGIAILTSQVDEEGEAAIVDGISRWRYQPYLVNGKAIDICFIVIYNYRIAGPDPK